MKIKFNSEECLSDFIQNYLGFEIGDAGFEDEVSFQEVILQVYQQFVMS